MEVLKNLFKTKEYVKKTDIYENVIPLNPAINELKTYESSGLEDSKNAYGSPEILKTSLENVYEGYLEKCRKDEEEQKQLKAPIEAAKGREKNELNKHQTLQDIKENELISIIHDIDKIDHSISHVRSEPEKYGLDISRKPKAQFYIGLTILMPITIYLIVFYLSASYSGFFKNFESTEIASAIFDGHAIEKAFQDGWLEAVFVCTIPFAFMGLGYLIHMFLKEKKTGWIKIVLMFLITFIFDAILAYLIESKIYEMTKTLEDPIFNLSIAFTKVEFWGIIFAGFVVYIIWGLVFDFVMKEHEAMDKINNFIDTCKEDKEHKISKKEELQEKINELKGQITEIKGKIDGLQRNLDGCLINKKKYLLFHSEYLKGWKLAISSQLQITRAAGDILLTECESISQKHLDNLNNNNNNDQYENTISA
jgi:hypothetical protein